HPPRPTLFPYTTLFRSLTPRDRAAGRGADTAGLTGHVARKAAVVRAHLPVRQVDLEPENGPDPADRELEVRTEPGARVPLAVAVAGQVAVVDVVARCRHLVEESGDRHLRRRRLSKPRRCQRHDDGEGEYRRYRESSHHCPPQDRGEPQLNLVTASRRGHHQQLPGNGADEK